MNYLEEELELLEASKAAILRSKRTAGILYIPSELSVEYTDGPAPESKEDFEKELAEALTRPRTPEEQEIDGRYLCQMIIRGPVELEEKIRHIKLDRDPTGEQVSEIDVRVAEIKERLEVLKNSVDTDDEEVVQ